MKGHVNRIRLAAAMATTTVVALGLSPSSSANSIVIWEPNEELAIAPPKQSPACQGLAVALRTDRGQPSELRLYTWSVCGRSKGLPFG